MKALVAIDDSGVVKLETNALPRVNRRKSAITKINGANAGGLVSRPRWLRGGALIYGDIERLMLNDDAVKAGQHFATAVRFDDFGNDCRGFLVVLLSQIAGACSIDHCQATQRKQCLRAHRSSP